jgi:autotransporter-associated beta strand protein
VTLNPSSGSAAVLALTSASASISTLSSSGAGTSSLVLGNAVAPSATALTLGGGNFSGGISNASPSAVGSLIISASNGSVTLSGSSSYSGGTTLSAGTLQIGNASALGSGTLAINGGALGNASGSAVTLASNNPQVWNSSFSFGGPNDLNLGSGAVTLTVSPTLTVTSNNLTVGGNIAGTGFSLTKAGLGNLVLGGANTYNSGTLVLAGTLTAASDTALSTGPVTLSPGAGTAVLALTSGAPSINLLTTSGASSVVLGNVANSTSTALTLGAGGSNMTLSTVFSDQSASNALAIGGLIKAGSGLLTLNGANTYTGPTTVSVGTLSAVTIVPGGGASNIGNSTSALVLGSTGSQGTLYYTGLTVSYSNGFTVNAGGGQFINAGSGLVTVQTGAININGGGTFTVSGASNNVSISSAISGSGGLTKTGADTLTLSSTASNYNGPTTLQAGTLSFTSTLGNAGVPGPLGAPTGSNATVNLYPGTTFGYTGGQGTALVNTNLTINLAGSGSGVVKVNGTVSDNDSQFYYNGPTTATGTGPRTLQLEANGDRQVLVWGGGIPNMSDGSPVSLSLIWGNGSSVANEIINLTGTNTFTGPITLTGGGQGNNLNAGTLLIGGSGGNYVNNVPSFASYGNAVLGNGNYPGNITFTASTADPVQLYYASSANQTFAGVISGPGLLVMGGTGSTLTLTGSDTYTGATTVSHGTLQIGNNTSGEYLSSGSVSVANGAALVFKPGDTLNYGGTISGSGSVTMAGTGTVNLSGNNTFTGTARIQSGVLQVGSNSALGSGGVTVNGGTLDLAGITIPTSISKFSGAGGVITNSNVTSAVLQVSQTSATTFSGAFKDGAGQVGLNLQGGTLTLLGNNTYSGVTYVNFSSALIAGAPNVLSASTSVSMFGSLLDVTAGSQNVGSLSFDGGSTLNLGIGKVLTSLGSVYFNGTLNITGATSALTELIAYPNASYNSFSNGAFSTVDLNGSALPSGFSLVYNNNQLDLVEASSSGAATWNVATSGSWTVGTNWSTGNSPSGIGAIAVLGSATTSPTTISLDSPQTIGLLTFANSAASYTLTAGSAGSLTLDNSGGTIGGQIIVLSGTHSIAAPLIISSSAAYVSITSGGSLDISGNIGQANGSHSLSLSSSDASGVLSLDGSNSFSGGVYVNSGTLILNGANALAAGSTLVIGATSPPSVPSVLASPAAAPRASLAPVPEPGTLTLFVVCATAMGFGLWRRNTKLMNLGVRS